MLAKYCIKVASKLIILPYFYFPQVVSHVNKLNYILILHVTINDDDSHFCNLSVLKPKNQKFISNAS